jgi:hypothetical protein
MSRTVQLVLLCEDRQHETLARRFLEKAGWPTRRLRVEIAPPGRGSAEQFVRERFPVELSAYRSTRNQVTQALVVIIDGDKQGVRSRFAELADACHASNIPPRQDNDHVLVAVPTWNIETWLAYLGGLTVDEGRDDYPRLSRPRECQQHVNRLYEMCQQGSLRQPSPPSLDAACNEYRSRLQRRQDGAG